MIGGLLGIGCTFRAAVAALVPTLMFVFVFVSRCRHHHPMKVPHRCALVLCLWRPSKQRLSFSDACFFFLPLARQGRKPQKQWAAISKPSF